MQEDNGPQTLSVAGDVTADGAVDAAADVAAAARGRRVTDPEEALRLFLELRDGKLAVLRTHEANGRCYVVARVATNVESQETHDEYEHLSRRERQVASGVALGQSNKEIAAALALSVSTVATHLRTAIRKLGLSSRAELAQRFLGRTK